MSNAAEKQLDAERRDTNLAQARAADPNASAWVSANAGTGKTHVLTNRVLRLLVAGVKPERILCLTYTKAAAAEMSERVFARLAHWVTAGNEDLADELTKLKLATPSPEELARARDLFAVAIETPGGLKVQTIHAFCERLLQRFPLEAQIAPQFNVLDEVTGAEIARRSIDEVLAEATATPNAPLGRDLNTAVAYAVDDAFDDLLKDALRQRDWIEAAIRLDNGEGPAFHGAEQAYRRMLDVRDGATLQSITAEQADVLSDADLARCRSVLAEGKKSDADAAEKLRRALGAKTQIERIAAIADALLTKEGEARARVITKALAEASPDVEATLTRAQERFLKLARERSALIVVASTVALLRLSDAVQQRYTEHKRRRAALDFDDLIRATRNLLSDGPAAEWVLFKLDGGLDHILVDEAQDTARPQWDIIRALAGEFFSGSGAREDLARTVFAVGDEKQSIYGFQGAVPELFAEMGRRFAELARHAGQGWNSIPLTLSFRTVAPVLDAVDRVFADGGGAVGVTASGATVRHAANRIGAAGVVEIWDTVKAEKSEAAEVWSPLDDKAPDSAVTALAARIADTIAHWIRSGERLQSEDRPIRAGDVLILVRRRRPFADAMVAALKARKIPVAGADRIRLTEQLAVLDLMALCDFLLLPEDELALATVLKSPFFGLDDDDLLAIAPKRRGSLWSALLAAAVQAPRFQEAAETLKRWRGRADAIPPFELLVEILDHDGMRTRLLGRLGPEATEPIDALLGMAISYDDSAPPSLQGFIDWLRSNDREIKRDMEHGRNEVRVMTVHGAKGLEAPIVFLPDTCSTKSGGRAGGLLPIDAEVRPAETPSPFVWTVKGSKGLDAVKVARETTKAREAAERNRLLYVALTRARDRLYVTGFENSTGRDKGCWYDLISDALADQVQRVETEGGGSVLRIATPQTAKPETARSGISTVVDALEPPEWSRRRAASEPSLTIPMAPSRLAPLDVDAEGDPVEAPRDIRAEPTVMASSRGTDAQRFLRGTLTHALLEHLPTLPRSTWKTAAREFVALRGADLRPRARSSIVAETMAILDDPAFGAIFGPDSRAEVPIVAELTPPGGKGQALRVAGQIDRLVHLKDHVLIVDYKTNRPPPTVAEAVAEAYLLQLAAYRLAVSKVFQSLPVRAALLWTDGPRLMEIPPAMLDAAESRLFKPPHSRDDAVR